MRVICRIANIHGKGIIRSVPVSQRGQQIRQRKPGVAKIRFYRHGAAHRLDRSFILPRLAQRKTQLKMDQGSIGTTGG